MFQRVSGIKRALKRPYTGPHKIVNRMSDRVFDIVNGKQHSVSVENLKPAYGIRDVVATYVVQPQKQDKQPIRSATSSQL